jgi:hypothetical protein
MQVHLGGEVGPRTRTVECTKVRPELSLDIPFLWQGHSGEVHVECQPNVDPAFWGCWNTACKGFAVCTATVDYLALGYRSMMAWVQLVRSIDNGSAGEHFELDPFALFGDAPSP